MPPVSPRIFLRQPTVQLMEQVLAKDLLAEHGKLETFERLETGSDPYVRKAAALNRKLQAYLDGMTHQ